MLKWEKSVEHGATRQEEKGQRGGLWMEREDMQIDGVTDECAEHRKRWKQALCCDNPNRNI